jgi:hypothetical protein
MFSHFLILSILFRSMIITINARNVQMKKMVYWTIHSTFFSGKTLWINCSISSISSSLNLCASSIICQCTSLKIVYLFRVDWFCTKLSSISVVGRRLSMTIFSAFLKLNLAISFKNCLMHSGSWAAEGVVFKYSPVLADNLKKITNLMFLHFNRKKITS